jgi:hypothetical protein
LIDEIDRLNRITKPNQNKTNNKLPSWMKQQQQQITTNKQTNKQMRNQKQLKLALVWLSCE